MSLDVSPELLAQAEAGPVSPDAFLDTVRTSLPYAYAMVERLAKELGGGDAPFADNVLPPEGEERSGEQKLLRALSSNAIRASLEQHFRVALAFQNCHRLAAFPAGGEGSAVYRRFTSERAQLLESVAGAAGLLRIGGSRVRRSVGCAGGSPFFEASALYLSGVAMVGVAALVAGWGCDWMRRGRTRRSVRNVQ